MRQRAGKSANFTSRYRRLLKVLRSRHLEVLETSEFLRERRKERSAEAIKSHNLRSWFLNCIVNAAKCSLFSIRFYRLISEAEVIKAIEDEDKSLWYYSDKWSLYPSGSVAMHAGISWSNMASECRAYYK